MIFWRSVSIHVDSPTTVELAHKMPHNALYDGCMGKRDDVARLQLAYL